MTQEEALDILKMGHNVFLTGPAGSGKTYVLNSYIAYLKANNIPVAITASTGIAATHMDGVTVHSWSGVGKRKSFEDSKDFFKVVNTPRVKARVSKARVLIIDEVSMLDAKVLDLVSRVCSTVRENKEPFGGLQVVLCGDFFQLPPVQGRNEPKPEFVFNSVSWQRAHFAVCYLEKQYRQEDLRFLNVLNAVREDRVTQKTVDCLMERYQQSIDGVTKPTKLYTHNRDVDALNNIELSKINEPPQTYLMTSEGDPELVKNLKKDCLAPETLQIKKGTLVMFVKNNFDKGYVNGTLGIVTGFDKDSMYPNVETRDGKNIIASPTSWVHEEDDIVLAQIHQVPLRLAWAITVHKSQGMTLDFAEIDLSKAFVEGMGYVALSRVRSLSGIKLMGHNQMSLKVSPEIKDQDQDLRLSSIEAHESLKAMSPADIEKRKKEIIQLWFEAPEDVLEEYDF